MRTASTATFRAFAARAFMAALIPAWLVAACARPRSAAPSAERATTAPAANDTAAHDAAAHAAHHATSGTAPGILGDSAFGALQARGAASRGMGVDQWTSAHRFDSGADGGRIELRREVDDPKGVAQIRRHLQGIAAAFTAGDFRTPGFVHAEEEVPGTRVMAARRASIVYAYRELPRGGEVRITTRDPDALHAVHEFLAYQRGEHRAAGHAHP